MPRPRSDSDFVRTTIELPAKLWDRAKRRALDERTDLRTLIIEGLEMRLKKGGGR